ncbi:MAG TPA: PAS domain S-box protein [Rhodocyclaceae bacterium]|nr:PAS domain S-box protein [Rhodocyclaceae bacterium]
MTSFLLGKLRGRRPGGPANGDGAASRRHLLLPLFLLVAAIAGLTAIAIDSTVDTQEGKELARLQAIADLKARQLTDWLEERYGEARFLRDSQYWGGIWRHWRQDGSTASRDLLLHRLDEFRSQDGFRDVILLDEDGSPLWSAAGGPPAVDPALAAFARKAGRRAEVGHFGPYRDRDGRLHLDFVAPLAGAGNPAPVVLLRTDPADYLSRDFQAWPVPGTSGEILLFRRGGDQVLYINELRHHGDQAMTLRAPLQAGKLLAARVLRGEARMDQPLEGVDYRGVPVTGVAQPIAGTDWFLMAKLDQEEVSAEAVRSAQWIALAGLLALAVAVAGAVLFYLRQRLAASRAERESQAERLRALQILDTITENSTDHVFVKDTAGRYLFLNGTTARFMGKSKAEVLGRSDTDLFGPTVAATMLRSDRRAMSAKQPFTEEEDIATPDGTATFLTTKGPMRDADGRLAGVFGIAHDITLRKQAESQVRQLSLAVEQSPVSIVITDLDATIQYVNQAFVDKTGYSRQEVVGRNVGMVKSGMTPAECYTGLWDALALGSSWKGELRNRRKNGEQYVDLTVIAPIRQADGGITNYVAVQEDITEKKRLTEELARRAQELQESNRALREETEMRRQTEAELRRSNSELEQIAYITSHDLQEPLRTVASFVQLLAQRNQERLDEESNQFIRFAVDGVARMQAIIQDILEYSRVGGAADRSVEFADTSAAFAAAMANLQGAIAAAGAQVTSDPLPPVAVAPQRLTQLFQNLVGNSLKFRGPEAPVIHVSAEREDGMWRFCVQDNGIGIDPRYHDKIFVIFQRLHSRSEYQGTGIGLALCKKIVERHGGRIWVESAPGAGARFCFTLPRAVPQ